MKIISIIVIIITFFDLLYSQEYLKLIPMVEGNKWLYDGIRISSDKKDTINYKYIERIEKTEKLNDKEYFTLISTSTERNSKTQFTHIRADSNGLYIFLEIEQLAPFEILSIKYPIKLNDKWKLFDEKIIRFKRKDKTETIKFCGEGEVFGSEVISFNNNDYKTFRIDNIFTQEIITTDDKSDTLEWINREEIHQLYVVPQIGIVKNIEIDAIGNIRNEILESFIPR